MAIYKIGGNAPRIQQAAFIADSADIIGQVCLGSDVSVWFGVVVRGDNEPVTIGERSNIQENCVLHTDPGFPLVTGSNVTVGHQATLHGCTIGDSSLIGMGAIVLNGAVIGKQSIVAAGSLITAGQRFPDQTLIMGSPAKVFRVLNEQELIELNKSAERYVIRAQQYGSELASVDQICT